MNESRVCVVQPVAQLAREILMATFRGFEANVPERAFASFAEHCFKLAEAFYAEGTKRGLIEPPTPKE